MDFKAAVLAAEQTFFSSLVYGTIEELDRLLTDDFLLIDVLRGAEVTKPALLDALGGRQVTFEGIDAAESRVRLYDRTAVVTGRTEMMMQFGDQAANVRSRYTHVYVNQAGACRLASAQGTPIAD